MTSDYIIDCAISWIIKYVIRLPDLDNTCPGRGGSNVLILIISCPSYRV